MLSLRSKFRPFSAQNFADYVEGFVLNFVVFADYFVIRLRRVAVVELHEQHFVSLAKGLYCPTIFGVVLFKTYYLLGSKLYCMLKGKHGLPCTRRNIV